VNGQGVRGSSAGRAGEKGGKWNHNSRTNETEEKEGPADFVLIGKPSITTEAVVSAIFPEKDYCIFVYFDTSILYF
jgi:hypothetical protein